MGKLVQIAIVVAAAWFGLSALGMNPFSANEDEGLRQLTDEARAKGKDKIVILLTGTDWCPYCKELDQNVIDTAAWESFADLRVVFAKYEYPASGRPRRGARGEMLKRFNPPGFPTLVVLDDEGEFLDQQAGYGDQTFAYYKDWIESL